MAIYKDVEPLELVAYESDNEEFDKGAKFILEKLDALPTADVISAEAYNQVAWERDMAMQQIESYGVSFGSNAELVEVVRCKDCVWFVPEHIKLSDGTTRPYTDEEKKMPCGVTSDIGINVGSYCLRKGYWKQNSIPVWFQENDFCSYGERRDT
jgi:hypothetical protein